MTAPSTLVDVNDIDQLRKQFDDYLIHLLSIFISNCRMDVFKLLEEHYISAEAICGSLMEGVIISSSSRSFLYWNSAARFYLGSGPQNVRPEEWAKEYGIYDVEGRELIEFDKLPLIRALGGEEFTDNRYMSKNLNFPAGIVLSVSGKPLRSGNATVGAVLTFRDLTNEMILEKELSSEEKFYKNILDLMPGIVFIKDLEGKYIYGNKCFHELLHAESVIGKRTEDFLPSDMAELTHEHDQYVLKSGLSKTFEEVIYWPNNTRGIFLTTRFPYRDIHQNIRGVCVVGHDITKEVDMELDLQKEREKNIHVSKLAVIGIMANEISKKIVDPIEKIRYLQGSIKENLTGNEVDMNVLNQKIDELKNSIDEMNKAAEALNKYGDIQSSKLKEKVSFGEVFHIVESLVMHRVRRSEVHWNKSGIDDYEIMLFANRIQLTEVVLNLVIIALNTVEAVQDKKVMISSSVSHETFIFEVRYNGHTTDLNDLTSPTGLSWDISQRIIHQQQGKVEHLTKDDMDSLFMSFPLLET